MTLLTLKIMLLIASVNALLTTAYTVLYLNLSLSSYVAVTTAFLSTLLSNLLGKFNIRVGSLKLCSELKKASVIKLSNGYLVQSLRFKALQNTVVELNLGGVVMPLMISMLILTHISTYYGVVPLLTSLLLVVASTLIINRVSVVIKGLGLAVPVIVVSTVTSLLSLLVAVSTAQWVGLGIHYSYLVAYTSTLLGVDLMNISKISFYDARRLIIGGLKVYDALSIVPAASTVITYLITTALNTYLKAKPISHVWLFLTA